MNRLAGDWCAINHHLHSVSDWSHNGGTAAPAFLREDRMEMWRHIPEYERYKISNLGRVVGPGRRGNEKLLKLQLNHNGYLRAYLSKNGKARVRPVHQLVLEAFIGSRPDGHQCAHINGNRLDNRLENLKYCTVLENIRHKYIHGTMRTRGPDGNMPNGRLTSEDRIEIRERHIRGPKGNTVLLAKEFKVTVGTITRLIAGKTWKEEANALARQRDGRGMKRNEF